MRSESRPNRGYQEVALAGQAFYVSGDGINSLRVAGKRLKHNIDIGLKGFQEELPVTLFEDDLSRELAKKGKSRMRAEGAVIVPLFKRVVDDLLEGKVIVIDPTEKDTNNSDLFVVQTVAIADKVTGPVVNAMTESMFPIDEWKPSRSFANEQNRKDLDFISMFLYAMRWPVLLKANKSH
ncbi:MAG: hypothetical protein H0W89_04385 [Candidatus Levybacteria bacterium]|nr:hypothetical protein [Candidatus Levybacteria bacterium]